MKLHSRSPRIVLYSHDAMGLGHIRRNLLIAQVLSKSYLQPNILLVCGALEARNFSMPEGVDCTVLPSLYREQDGTFRPRSLRMNLNELVSLRRKILLASISAFEPDVLIVDYMPWGAIGELDSILEYVRAQGQTRCVLGIRDIWGEPAIIQREWSQRRNWDAIRRYYDQIWVYGDPAVYDPVQEYHLDPDIVDKIRYTGYLHQGKRLEFMSWKDRRDAEGSLELLNSPFAVCTVGGGQDGARLAEAFLETRLPQGSSGLVITGPRMDPEDLRRLYDRAARNPLLKILDFTPEPIVLLQHAECFVAMGGYNTICEIMSFRKRALIVPRSVPSKEQLIRAQRLQSLGVLDVLHPDHLEPMAITRWLERNMGKPPPSFQADMNGLARVLELLESLLTETNMAATNSKLHGVLS